MISMEGAEVAVIGGGPRGTSVLERLIAHRNASAGPQEPLTIHIVDPFDPGPGHVWRTDQSRLFLMNTPSLFPTVVPVGEAAAEVPASPVPVDFDSWRTLAEAGGVEGLTPEETAEAARVGSAGFPSRALYGRYLAWVYAALIADPGEGVTVIHHRREALSLRRAGARWELQLDGGEVLGVDGVVLALGHLPARLNPEQGVLQDGAARYGLQYWPPAVPGDLDWKRLPAGKSVLVRGLGLNFFDVMIQLTEGRGGRFTDDGSGQLAYTPSGREPVLIAASRRGVPYRAKAAITSYIPRGISLSYCTVETLGAFAEAGIQPGFDHDVWPLLHRDVLAAYYRTLARVRPDAFLRPADAALAELRTALDIAGPGWLPALQEFLDRNVPAELQLNVEALAQPFAGRRFADSAALTEAVLNYLDEDAAGSARGEDDPLKMAIGAMNAGRTVIKQVVADGGLTDSGWYAELRGWFEPLVEGLASGPPPLRIAQLAALVRADLVRFVGPNPLFALDPDDGVFRASSPWVGDPGFTAGYLVEAMMPANQVSTSLSVLMRQMLEEGVVRPHLRMAEDGVPVVSAGLDVTLPPYRPLSGTGEAQPGLYVCGLQLASVQWGAAIAAEAGASLNAGARTLQDADAIAEALIASFRDSPDLQTADARA
ncbi:FAD/NAD(P)-binding protein [Arthrobacter zhaoguopingii]|uniref:FAD/NAD(P)-binding protein n=1 Tax=Arthrobacter zhaoguopingii TaxID=2681491 RepID=UPI00135C54BB|nr:FAD/NAD(P)-binding protein [Arthrobacter zhaoguopingii]